MKTITVLLCAMVLAGCSSSVRLRHPQSGQVVSCGPYAYFGVFVDGAVLRELRCLDDFQRQGYERVAN